MQAKEKRQLVLLGILLSVLVAVTWWQMRAPVATGAAPPGAPAARAGRPQAAAAPRTGGAGGPVVVHLAWLDAPRPEPKLGSRDPFAFGSGPVAGAPPPGTGPVGPGAPAAPAAAPVGPPEPPPPPPIPYRFIGLLDAPGSGPVAVLSDGRFVYHGREGDIIDGRYRLVSVNGASVQLEYLDGRGRQTLRLSGS